MVSESSSVLFTRAIWIIGKDLVLRKCPGLTLAAPSVRHISQHDVRYYGNYHTAESRHRSKDRIIFSCVVRLSKTRTQ